METVKLWRKGKQILHEQREWTGLGYHSLFGRSYIYIKCPFCGAEVKAFVWSLAGCGKKCNECDAQFASFGMAFKKIKDLLPSP
jgi:hypothetical protein